MTDFGLGAPIRDFHPGEFERFLLCRPKAVVDLHHFRRRWPLFASHGIAVHGRWDVRGPLVDGRAEAETMANDLRPYKASVADVRIRNEGNVLVELATVNGKRATARQWRDHLIAIGRSWDELEPGVPLAAPAVSPSAIVAIEMEDGQKVTESSRRWIEATVEAAYEAVYEKLDGHFYGSPDECAAILELVRSLWPKPKPLVWTEYNFGAGRTIDWPTYLAWLPEIAALAKEHGTSPPILYVWDWPHPDSPIGTTVNVVDTPVEQFLREVSDEMLLSGPADESYLTRGDPMLRGLALWVWYWDDRYLDLAEQVGASTLLIKAADGPTAWDEWERAATKCQARGIGAIPWAYNYGDPKEIAALVQACDRTGVKSFIVDPEIEFERMMAEQQRTFVEAIRSAKVSRGLRVGCATWARPEAHRGYRFDYLAEVVDFWLPMIAWQAWEPRDAARWLEHWDSFSYKPTVPWLPAYEGVTADELAASVKLALERYGAATIWAAHTLTEEGVKALEAMREQATAAGQQDDPVTAFVKQVGATGNVADVLHLLWALSSGQRTGGDPGAAACIEAAVIRIKQLVGLQ